MTYYAGVSKITTGNTYILSYGDGIFVPGGAYVASEGSSSIVSDGLNNVVASVAGSVSGLTQGIRLGNNAAAHNMTVNVFSTGVVSGQAAGVTVYGYDARVTNFGTISGIFGLGLIGDTSASSASYINNGGTIVGSYIGISVAGSDRHILRNSGTIDGALYSYSSSDASVDKMFNSGHMYGDVNLGAGSDTFDNLGGTLFGTVFGVAGNDYFAAGASVDNFDGGADIDTVRFDLGGAVRVALDRSVANTGWAAGDSYTGIENVIGSNLGADILIGDNQNNNFSGGGGNDFLSTGLGNDRLEGGQGIDRLIGGAGNDAFFFIKPTDGGDMILDFSSNAVGNDDYFFIYSVLFGGGLTPGVLAAGAFLASAGNVGTDADDRFILRTGDKTVWFDVDGAGGVAPVMIADLQATATVTASDFIMF